MALKHTGRIQAQRLYPVMLPCEKCGASASDRHHKDENPLNNSAGNIEFLCRRCHMETDGRLSAFRNQAVARITQTTESAAAARRARTHCKRGHLLGGENLYIKPAGNRVCITCRKMEK